MYYTKEQPTLGSFSKVWVYGGNTFSSDYKFIDGVLHTFNDDADEYEEATGNQTALDPIITDIMYITLDVPKYTEMV